MGVLALSYEPDKYKELYDYLAADTDFWIKNDIWMGRDKAFGKSEIPVQERAKTWTIADFTTFRTEGLKIEMKYFILKQLKTGELTVVGCNANYLRAIRNIGISVSNCSALSFADINGEDINLDDFNASDTERRIYRQLKGHVIRFTDSRISVYPYKRYDSLLCGVVLLRSKFVVPNTLHNT